MVLKLLAILLAQHGNLRSQAWMLSQRRPVTQGEFAMTKGSSFRVTALTVALALGFVSQARAQQQTRRPAGETPGSAAAGFQVQRATQDRAKSRAQSSQAEIIRGVVAGITAEGEVMLDYRTNAAARTQGAFLTIVGSPIMSGADERSRGAGETDARAASGKKRHNVYIAWLAPRTKITDASKESGRPEQNQRPAAGETPSRVLGNEIPFDQLEVGDRVEIQFIPQEESAQIQGVHQNERMRQTHGRHRTFVGTAMSITVLPHARHEAKGESGTAGRPGGRLQ
jgi:hypothetical protein